MSDQQLIIKMSQPKGARLFVFIEAAECVDLEKKKSHRRVSMMRRRRCLQLKGQNPLTRTAGDIRQILHYLCFEPVASCKLFARKLATYRNSTIRPKGSYSELFGTVKSCLRLDGFSGWFSVWIG